MVTFLFSAYFGSHSCYHSNGKNRTNPRLLHLGYRSNKLIRRNLWKAFFILWPHRGAKIVSKRTYPFNQIGDWSLKAMTIQVYIYNKIKETCVFNISKKRIYMSHDMRFPTMWYVWPTKPQISLRIHVRMSHVTAQLFLNNNFEKNIHFIYFRRKQMKNINIWAAAAAWDFQQFDIWHV